VSSTPSGTLRAGTAITLPPVGRNRATEEHRRIGWKMDGG
jgi:hypothetical protein